MDLLNQTGLNCTINCTTVIYNYKPYLEEEHLSQIYSIAMAAIFIIIIVTAIFANTLLIITIVLSRHLYSITHVFIVNLAIADMITAIFVIPFDASFMIEGCHSFGIVPCAINHITFLMSLPVAVLNLCLLTMERYITISYPFRRQSFFSAPRIVAMLLTTWLYTLLVSLFPIMYNSNALRMNQGYCELEFPVSYSIFHGVVNFLLPILGILLFNFLIVRIANQQERKIESTLHDKKKHQTKLLSFRKGAKRIMLLVGVCVFCWLTFITLVIWNNLCGVCHPRELTWIGNAINYASVSINPILYGIINVSIRKEICKQCRSLFFVRSGISEERRKHNLDVKWNRFGISEYASLPMRRANKVELVPISHSNEKDGLQRMVCLEQK